MPEARPLLGDEAVALAAIHAGLSGGYSYPGTPATEILEFVERETHGGPPAAAGGVTATWAANEKVAYEQALGMSYAGRRALVSFKHVGLNVAADPFMNSAVTGVTGGLVVAVADDPGMHSSQNEQDSRYFAQFALVPALEPSNGQEAYDMTREAYELSERFGLPVMLRLVTRLAHSRSGIVCGERRPPNPLAPTTRTKDWTLLPSIARVGYARLVDKQAALEDWAESSRWNDLHLDPAGGRTGVIAAGATYNYFRENLAAGEPLPPHLKIGAYPAPAKLIRRLLDSVDTILVLEDSYPFLETMIRGLFGVAGKTIRGRLDGTLPRTGELTPDIVRGALGKPALARQQAVAFPVPGRPPCLCDGCPHIDTYDAIKTVLDEQPSTRVFGDIGCYTLGAYDPYQACHSCVDMGASISMAMGASQAGLRPALAVIGDSTFMHSGMTPLVGAARANVDMTVFILDNATVAMTGGQPTMATGEALVRVVKGLGVDPEHLHVIRPHRKEHDKNVALIRREIAHPGLSVIIPVRECIVAAKK